MRLPTEISWVPRENIRFGKFCPKNDKLFTKILHKLSVSGEKMLLLTKKIEKVYFIRNIFCLPERRNFRHFSVSNWEPGVRPNSRMLITFSALKAYMGYQIFFSFIPSCKLSVLLSNAVTRRIYQVALSATVLSRRISSKRRVLM